MKRRTNGKRFIVGLWFLLLVAGGASVWGQQAGKERQAPVRSDMLSDEDDQAVWSKIVRLPKGRRTVYQWLNEITDRTGLLFIYDSKLIDNERKVRLREGTYRLSEAIRRITEKPELVLRMIGNHILLQTGTPAEPLPNIRPETLDSRKPDLLVLEGVVLDPYTEKPVAFGSVGLKGTSLGTITNGNGEFRLTIPDSLRTGHVVFSHLGYQPKELACVALEGIHPSIVLEPKIIPIQEVVIRRVNPLRLLDEMREAIGTNYANRPVYHTAFYREGIERRKGFVSLTEAVFKIYKASYRGLAPDQVKLLKMRRISNEEESDTLITRMKSGVNACLMLDVIKHFPGFLSPEEEALYQYVHTDMTEVENRLVNVIAFEQRAGVSAPLYKGELFVDAENGALVQVRFEVNPRYVRKATGMFVVKKTRDLKIVPQQVVYTVGYKPWNGVYYVHHVRGDLYFKIKKRKQFFNTTLLHTWFEMVTCKTDTSGVHRFARNETLPTRSVFSETRFTYDGKFWEGFNVIPPEEKLTDAIGKITSKIEETTE